MRDVQVTLQDVHHPRCHENGAEMAGNARQPPAISQFSKPDFWGSAGFYLVDKRTIRSNSGAWPTR